MLIPPTNDFNIDDFNNDNDKVYWQFRLTYVSVEIDASQTRRLLYAPLPDEDIPARTTKRIDPLKYICRPAWKLAYSSPTV